MSERSDVKDNGKYNMVSPKCGRTHTIRCSKEHGYEETETPAFIGAGQVRIGVLKRLDTVWRGVQSPGVGQDAGSGKTTVVP